MLRSSITRQKMELGRCLYPYFVHSCKAFETEVHVPKVGAKRRHAKRTHENGDFHDRSKGGRGLLLVRLDDSWYVAQLKILGGDPWPWGHARSKDNPADCASKE